MIELTTRPTALEATTAKTPPVGERVGETEKNEIAARNERGRQAISRELDRPLTGQRSVGDSAERFEFNDVIIA